MQGRCLAVSWLRALAGKEHENNISEHWNGQPDKLEDLKVSQKSVH